MQLLINYKEKWKAEQNARFLEKKEYYVTKLTSLHSRISPFAFLTRRSMLVKYQNRDFAITWFDANICIL